MATSDLPLGAVELEPERPSAGAPPAVFLLHGRRGDERMLLSVARGLPDELATVSLRAPIVCAKAAEPLSESDARDISPWEHGGVVWYDPEASGPDAAKPQPRGDQLRESVSRVSESVTAAVDASGFDPDRLGLLGFDQGAVVSLALLCAEPDRFAWVVALNGYLPAAHVTPPEEGLDGTPVFLSAGEHDPMVPAGRTVAAADRLREHGADVTLELYESSHGIGAAELDDVSAFVEAALA